MEEISQVIKTILYLGVICGFATVAIDTIEITLAGQDQMIVHVSITSWRISQTL